METKKKLGIIGGLGPMATVYLYERIVAFTDAKTDQEHIDITILNRPEVPDRTEYLLDNTKKNPLPMLIDMGKTLEKMRTNLVAMPCITAHYFYKELQNEISVPFLNMIEETALDLQKNDYKKVAIMATTGTIKTKLFQKELEKLNIEPVIPEKAIQEKIMFIIYANIKKSLPADMDKFYEIQNYFIKKDAEQIILGCTELSIIKRDEDINSKLYTDAIDVLAKTAVQKAGYNLKVC